MTTDQPYQILVDATIDLTEKHRGAATILPMQIQLGSDTLLHNGYWSGEQNRAFYNRLRAGELPTTSQITPFDYETAFEKVLCAGQDALYLCLSSGLSDTVSSAQLAARNLKLKYPDRTVHVIDTLSAAYGETLMLEEVIKNRDKGMSACENARWIEEHKQEFAIWVTVEDLMYLRHGGRISTVAALMGSTFRIMPVIHVDSEGKLPVVEKVQGRKSAIKQLVRHFEKNMTADTRRVYVINADAPEEAEFLKRLVEHVRPDAEVIVGALGPVIGGHVGPGTLALAFRGKGR